jgi:hypothetical protein
MLNLLLPAFLLFAQTPPVETEAVAAPPAATAPTSDPAPAPAASAPASPKPAAANASQGDKPLSFISQRFDFRWDQTLPLNIEVDGLKINSVFFNKRTLGLFKGAEFGTRAVLAATNTATGTRTPGFALAVFDAQDRLLGVASGGPKIGGISAGDTETFDMSFHQVVERIPKADHFYLAVELTN